jgi:NAD(P)-dependent dehydrogenase (short-subunit alcohol dehydrogenase family)
MGDWKAANIPDLTGKIVLVTGANIGLGKASTRLMAARGAQVVMAVRTVSKGEKAADDVRSEVPNAQLNVMALDLADLASVRAFATDFTATHDRLDVLMNNAGVMATPQMTTQDGFELQFGTNHLGHYALTGLLIDTLLAMPYSRIINVSSGAADGAKIRFDDLMFNDNYSRFEAYGQSKLANLLFTVELHKRLTASGATTLSVATHPGVTSSNLLSGMRIPVPGITTLANLLTRLMFPDTATGALSQVRAAVDTDVKGGEYYGPDNGMRGWPVQIPMPEAVKAADAARLWEISADLTGVRFL